MINWIKFNIIKFIDWYVKTYHSDEFIHVSQIKDTILERIDSAVSRNNRRRDRELYEAIETERTKHRIVEDGYIAEIESLEKLIDESKNMRKEVEELYFKVVQRAQQIVMITAKNTQERKTIVNDLAATLGKLDKLALETEDLNKEIEKNKASDQDRLRIR